jgi:hypothetical protein
VFIDLVCWHCRNSKPLEVSQPPHSAFELVIHAHVAGMLGFIDDARGRVLVFCNQTCADAEKTKSGQFRLRPKGVPKEALPCTSYPLT